MPLRKLKPIPPLLPPMLQVARLVVVLAQHGSEGLRRGGTAAGKGMRLFRPLRTFR